MSSRPTHPRRGSRRAGYERPVEQLVLATNFTDDPVGQDPVEFIRQIRRYPQILERIQAWEDGRRQPDGRPRRPGSWVLLYLAFVMSRETVMYRFLAKWRSSPIWELCGFGDWRPHYNLLQIRFGELETGGLADAMRLAGDDLIRQARRHDERVGADGGADATSFAAHSRLRHCCPRDEHGRFACRRRGERRKPQTMPRSDGDAVERQRHHEAAEPSEEPSEATRAARRGMRPIAVDDPRLDGLPQDFRYFDSDGHLYRLRDHSAGPKRYESGDAWIGGLLMGIADVFTGAPLALRAISADSHEANAYPELLDRALAATDGHLVRVAGDRGYSLRPTFKHNTERGIASIFPYRRVNGSEPTRHHADRDDYDRHGVPRCRHCGGPGDVSGAQLGFHIARGDRPVVRFRCMTTLTTECGGIQEISCGSEWRMLVPLSRRHESYHAMRVAGKSLERAWSAWRERYGLAGKRPETRARRRLSIPCQELRAQTARFIEWFRVLARHGFLGSARRQSTLQVFAIDGSGRLHTMERARARHGLDRPYGAYAQTAGLAPDAETPPPDPDRPPDEPDAIPF